MSQVAPNLSMPPLPPGSATNSGTRSGINSRSHKGTGCLDIESLRAEFPILGGEENGKPLTFLDSAASAQKPQAVIEAIRHVYACEYANVHRGVYRLSQAATAAFEAVRGKVRGLINARSDEEIVFTSGATASINLVAQSWGRAQLKEGDEILLCQLEHHSNIVPWQLLAEEKGLRIRVIPIDDRGSPDMEAFHRLIGPRTRLLSVAHVSNALGTVLPVRDMAAAAHAVGAAVLLDGAQAIPHLPVDVQDLDCDFYAFSGHKLYGPTGTGILYGKADRLDSMPPWQGGGDMIRSVSFEGTTYAPPPLRFEAGTPNIAGMIGLGAAIDWFRALDPAALEAHEADLLAYGTQRLSEVPGLRLIGTAADKVAVLSFVMEGVHPHDIGTILDQEGVCVRVGHHCAQPVMDRYDIPATVRASFGLYNTREDVDRLIAALGTVREFFG